MECQSQCEQELNTSLSKLNQAEPVNSQLTPAAFCGLSLVKHLRSPEDERLSSLDSQKDPFGSRPLICYFGFGLICCFLWNFIDV
ncbi:hypothetical protein U0070_001701 [Myodes glareolus]|uniref:Uncharacterized protein n=1 Tax=Myodes glareolus TaxID=447135 RepID=A0AAW0JC80_MYOGA